MSSKKKTTIRIKGLIAPFLGCFSFFYFTYHILHGDRGIFVWSHVNKMVQNAKLELKTIRAKKRIFEHRVNLLQPENLDPDLLEERARLVLNYGYKNDIVVIEEKVARPK